MPPVFRAEWRGWRRPGPRAAGPVDRFPVRGFPASLSASCSAPYSTPLSVGVVNAALSAGLIGKFRFTPRGGIGLMNHRS